MQRRRKDREDDINNRYYLRLMRGRKNYVYLDKYEADNFANFLNRKRIPFEAAPCKNGVKGSMWFKKLRKGTR